MNATCSICLDDIDIKINIMTTDCGHCFHTNCFLQHVSHNGFTCPNCRNQIVDEPECDSDEDDYDDDDDYDDEDDDDECEEDDDECEEDNNAFRAMRMLFRRAENDAENINYEIYEERIQYERGHIHFGEEDLRPLSLRTIGERMNLRGITYNDLVALIVFPHKDNHADIAEYSHTRLKDIHRKIKDIIEDVPFVYNPVVEPIGSPLTMDDLHIGSPLTMDDLHIGSPLTMDDLHVDDLVTDPIIEFSPAETIGKPLTLDDLRVDTDILETIFDL